MPKSRICGGRTPVAKNCHRDRHRGLIIAVAVFGVSLLAAGAFLRSPSPLIVMATTPSVPMGLYWRSNEAPNVGAYVLLNPPTALRDYPPYADARARSFHIIKPVLASAGTQVCAHDHDVVIGGSLTLKQLERDSLGYVLPRFSECRSLEPHELFLGSNRIPDSLDSRYFGPVRDTEILGVYRPLWTPAFLDRRPKGN